MTQSILWIIKDKDKFVEAAKKVITDNPNLNKPENRTDMFFEIQKLGGCNCIGTTNQDADLLAANMREEGLRTKVVKIK